MISLPDSLNVIFTKIDPIPLENLWHPYLPPNIWHPDLLFAEATRCSIQRSLKILRRVDIDCRTWLKKEGHKTEKLDCKFINVCEEFIWRNSRPSLNRKKKYPHHLLITSTVCAHYVRVLAWLTFKMYIVLYISVYSRLPYQIKVQLYTNLHCSQSGLIIKVVF